VTTAPEFTWCALDEWAYRHGVTLHFIDPGKPTQKAYIESFNGKLRDECLDANYFLSLDAARRKIEAWRVAYNTARPHSRLGYRSPAEFITAIENNQRSAPESLERAPSSTNLIETLFSRMRERARRWRGGETILRWSAAGMLEAERNFRKIAGYRSLPKLKAALRAYDAALSRGADNRRKAA